MRARNETAKNLALLFAVFVALARAEVLPPWQPGALELHHIATGRGNATLILAPDGTSILVDAGAATGPAEVLCAPRPDASRRPGEWIGRYVQRRLRATGHTALDYFVLTHLHPDHVGDVGPDTPPAASGAYALTGVTDVAEIVPICTLIDRGFPDYAYPTRWAAGFAQNYFAFVTARQKAGAHDERVRVGATNQIVLRHEPARYPGFVVRAIAANGEVWAGRGESAVSSVPVLATLKSDRYPDENMCSIALRVSYGKFDYFTGGDLHCDTADGAEPWRDVETPAAGAAGPVDVAVANHHAYFDAVGADAVRALQPRVWIVPVWHVTHLSVGPLSRMLSEFLYAGPREVFATELAPATRLLDERFMSKVKSTSGHVVVRVAPPGDEFIVFVTDNRDESDRVLLQTGPYRCR